MSAHAIKNFDAKKTSGPIPLRFLHPVGANFDLPIRRKRLPLVLERPRLSLKAFAQQSGEKFAEKFELAGERLRRTGSGSFSVE